MVVAQPDLTSSRLRFASASQARSILAVALRGILERQQLEKMFLAQLSHQ